MKQGQRLWTKDELILAINLYSKLPFGRMHSRNPKVIELSEFINRTPGSVAFKLVNFASLDPNLQQRGIKGASNAGNLDKEIWKEFYNNWDAAFEESEKLYANYKHSTVEQLYDIDLSDIEKGIDKQRMIKTRVNQYRFREMVMANYNATCCITGIAEPQLLVASHITPWSKYENNRLNPSNGLCLNPLHDKTFDIGLLTISAQDYKIHISSKLKRKDSHDYFIKYEGKQITLPKKFLPNKDFLKIHNDFFKP